MNNKSLLASALLLATGMLASGASPAAQLNLLNIDAPGVGLNDVAPAAPVGGNPGKTVGEQRQIVYRYAMDSWGTVLQSPIPVNIYASFAPLTCTPTSGTLGSAGAYNGYFINFGDGTRLYPAALAEALYGADINALLGDPDPGDIISRFNGALGTASCLTTLHWYYGLDGKTPANAINFLNVVMHEIGHGLGAASFINKTTGAFNGGYPDAYTRFAYSDIAGKRFEDPTMTNAMRALAMRTQGATVWTGSNVNQQAALLLDSGYRETTLHVSAPAAVTRDFGFFGAAFGPAPTAANFSGQWVVATDAADVAGPSTTDACTAITNAAAVAGKVAMVDRGTCGFAVKAKNAQDAGAIAVVVLNSASTWGAMGGSGNPVLDNSITIPAVIVQQADGVALKANAPITGGMLDGPVTLAGADTAGRTRLYSPWVVATGSTFSHFDTALAPNALMEPFDTPSVQAQVNVDLTPAMFADIGWTLNPGNAKIGACDTAVDAVAPGGIILGANVVANSGVCTTQSKGSRTSYITCMVNYANAMKAKGLINTTQYGKVIQCAALRP